MFAPGQIIHYLEMCTAEGVNLQRGMNYRLNGGMSIILMSIRPNAPYADRVEDNGRVLVYEGHNIDRRYTDKPPEIVDQPGEYPTGRLTENGKFHNAAQAFKNSGADAERVKVYEKIKDGIWAFNGIFQLVDSWLEKSNDRMVFKFRLLLTDEVSEDTSRRKKPVTDLVHTRMIPSHVKVEVWKRDGGKCRLCGSKDNLHFDHIVPFSKGGTSLTAENVQLLCARHNLEKRDKIE